MNWLEAAERKARGILYRGRPEKTLPGSHVADLVALGKAIVLCGRCEGKFDHKRHGYASRKVAPYQSWIVGDCDGCKAIQARCVLYLKDGA